MNLTHHSIEPSLILHARFYYRNSENNYHRDSLPLNPTIHGTEMVDMDKEYAPFNMDYPHETLLEKARRLDILDTWTPVLVCKCKGRESYTFEGELAKEMWSEYRKWRYSKK